MITSRALQNLSSVQKARFCDPVGKFICLRLHVLYVWTLDRNIDKYVLWFEKHVYWDKAATTQKNNYLRIVTAYDIHSCKIIDITWLYKWEICRDVVI